MKPVKIHYNHWLPKFIGYAGITIGHNICVMYSKQGTLTRKSLVKHEMIHVAQIEEHTFIGFYLSYVFEFLKHFFNCWNWNSAYRSVKYEKEAYERQYEDLTTEELKALEGCWG